MKTYILTSLVFFLVMSCNSVNENSRIVSVTIEPQRYFVEKIAGSSNLKVNTIVPPGASPETYDPTPSQMVNLGKSSLYFKVGYLGFENAWGKTLEENNANVKVVNTSNEIVLIENDDTNENDGLLYHEGHDHSGVDPHIWSSPKSALIMAENMLNALVMEDVEHQKIYRDNFEALRREIIETDQKIASLLENASVKSFIIYHPALGYFARDYNLTQYSIEYDGKNPSPLQLRKMIDFAKEQGIKTIFVQKGYDMKNAESLAKEVGASIHSIDPLSYNWSEELIRIAEILAANE